MKPTMRKYVLLAILTVSHFFGYGFQTIPILNWLSLALTIHLFRNEETTALFTALYLLAVSISTSFSAAGFYSPAGPLMSRMIVSTFALIQHSIMLMCIKMETMYKVRFNSGSYVMVFPLLFTSSCFLWTRFSPFGSAGHMAYTQAGETSIVQLASLWGIHGILFLMSTVGSLAVASLQKPKESLEEDIKNLEPKPFYNKSHTFWMLAILISAMIYGGARTNMTNDTFYQRPMDSLSLRKPHDIACLSKVFSVTETNDQIVGEFEQIMKDNPNTKMIVTAENSFASLVYRNSMQEVQERLQKMVDTKGIYIILAFGTGYNSLTALLPNKSNVTYNKHHLIPLLERYPNPSDGKMPYFDTPEFGRVGFVICFDGDFPSYLHQASQLGVDLIFQAAQTYGPLRFVHAGFAKFRAVEQGATVLRCCRDGVSGLYDPFCRTLQEEETFKAAHKHLMKVSWSRKDRVWTLYGACGDLFSWISCAVSFGILLAVLLPKPAIEFILSKILSITGHFVMFKT